MDTSLETIFLFPHLIFVHDKRRTCDWQAEAKKSRRELKESKDVEARRETEETKEKE
jgi:hypothetical protein